MSIFEAIRNGDVDQLKTVIETTPSSLISTDERGSTPLVLASYLGSMEATKLLVEAGAELNTCGMTGTALMGVCFKGYAEIASYLIGAGANIDATHANGSTALTFAAMFNKVEIVKLLLEKGADAGAKDVNGLTAADHARSKGFVEVVGVLA
ncbi:MAG: ankyrin repeat protein [Neolewinella sp.]|jgi:ankyrin repeat protein